MSILTDGELEELMRGKSTFDFGIDVQSAVLEKLAGMELPEPVVIDRHIPTNIVIRGYTAEQLSQAYAQGAASVLNAEPVACIVDASDGANMVWPIADLDEARTYCAEEDDPVLLYALKTIE